MSKSTEIRFRCRDWTSAIPAIPLFDLVDLCWIQLFHVGTGPRREQIVNARINDDPRDRLKLKSQYEAKPLITTWYLLSLDSLHAFLEMPSPANVRRPKGSIAHLAPANYTKRIESYQSKKECAIETFCVFC